MIERHCGCATGTRVREAVETRRRCLPDVGLSVSVAITTQQGCATPRGGRRPGKLGVPGWAERRSDRVEWRVGTPVRARDGAHQAGIAESSHRTGDLAFRFRWPRRCGSERRLQCGLDWMTRLNRDKATARAVFYGCDSRPSAERAARSGACAAASSHLASEVGPPPRSGMVESCCGHRKPPPCRCFT